MKQWERSRKSADLAVFASGGWLASISESQTQNYSPALSALRLRGAGFVASALAAFV